MEFCEKVMENGEDEKSNPPGERREVMNKQRPVEE